MAVELEVLLPEGLQAPAVARGRLRSVSTGWSPEVVDAAVLLTSEVVTNAVRHGRPPVRLSVRTAPGLVRVEVRDGGSGLAAGALGAAAAMPAGDAHGGRGLPLLHLLAHRWGGVAGDGDGAGGRGEHLVWFELNDPRP